MRSDVLFSKTGEDEDKDEDPSVALADDGCAACDGSGQRFLTKGAIKSPTAIATTKMASPKSAR